MIEVLGLSKRFGTHLAVDQLSFNVSPGEVLGFLGPNGAGKSTSMKMITGFLRPTAGTARIAGFDIQTAPIEAKRRMGYLPEGAPGYGDMTVKDYLGFIADLRQLDRETRRRRIAAVVRDVHLEQVLHQRLETLSKGFRRRVGLAQSILHDPQILIMDEPTDGLDPNQKHEVRNLIRSMSQNRIIVISTHILEEVDAVCSRAIIISHGRLLADGTPAELAARSRYHGAIRMRLDEAVNAVDDLNALPEVVEVEQRPDGTLMAIPAPGANPMPAVARLIDARHWRVRELHQETGNLNDVFRTITGGAQA